MMCPARWGGGERREERGLPADALLQESEEVATEEASPVDLLVAVEEEKRKAKEQRW